MAYVYPGIQVFIHLAADGIEAGGYRVGGGTARRAARDARDAAQRFINTSVIPRLRNAMTSHSETGRTQRNIRCVRAPGNSLRIRVSPVRVPYGGFIRWEKKPGPYGGENVREFLANAVDGLGDAISHSGTVRRTVFDTLYADLRGKAQDDADLTTAVGRSAFSSLLRRIRDALWSILNVIINVIVNLFV